MVRLMFLCNIAGGFQMGETVFETLDETWDFLFNLNTKSVILHDAKDCAGNGRRGSWQSD